MNPTVALIAGLALRYGPAFAQAMQRLFAIKEPTQADWDRVWALAEKPHAEFMDEARRRAGIVTAPPVE